MTKTQQIAASGFLSIGFIAIMVDMLGPETVSRLLLMAAFIGICFSIAYLRFLSIQWKKREFENAITEINGYILTDSRVVHSPPTPPEKPAITTDNHTPTLTGDTEKKINFIDRAGERLKAYEKIEEDDWPADLDLESERIIFLCLLKDPDGKQYSKNRICKAVFGNKNAEYMRRVGEINDLLHNR